MGWIKINREITNHWLWQDAERLKWWFDLLFMANWESGKVLVGKQLVTLRRGQLIASLSFLCQRWKRSRSMVEPFLNMLIAEKMISKEANNNISIITITNYKQYQDIPQRQSKTKSDAYLTHRETECCKKDNAHLDAYHEAYLDATNKEYKEYIISHHQPRARTREESFLDELKNSTIWVEQMAMRFHISTDEVINKLNDFYLDVNCRGTEHRDINDAKKHFNDWLRIQITQNNDTTKRQPQSQRRAFEVTATSAQDYEGAF